jgi:ADP-heptose:LPS heptosyltransferase
MTPSPLLHHTLVIRPGALGDSILTLPALHALRLAGAENLLVLGTPASWGFVRNAHDGLRIRDFSSSEWTGLFGSGVQLGEGARAALSKVQTAIVYLNGETAQTEHALRAAGVKQIICAPPPTLQHAHGHAAKQLLDALAPLVSPEQIDSAQQVLDCAADPFLKIDDNERNRALYSIGFDAPPERGFAAIHPGSGGRAKCWPVERYAKLAVKLACDEGLVPLVFFGPADEGIREAFETSIPPGIEWECVDNRPLRDGLALLSCARVYIGNDSGMTHLAARACPTIALFGPSDPSAWAPLGRNVKIIRAPEGKLERICVDEVLQAV